MNEKILNTINIEHGAKILQFGAVASIIFGILLIGGGFFYRKKGKNWWMYLVILGFVSIVTNFLQLL